MPELLNKIYCHSCGFLIKKKWALGLDHGFSSLTTHSILHHLCAEAFQTCTGSSDSFLKLHASVPTWMTHSHLPSRVGREGKREERRENRELGCFCRVYLPPLLLSSMRQMEGGEMAVGHFLGRKRGWRRYPTSDSSRLAWSRERI